MSAPDLTTFDDGAYQLLVRYEAARDSTVSHTGLVDQGNLTIEN